MYRIERAYREAGKVIRQNCVLLESGEELEYLTYPSLEETGIVSHLITTRLGGVSKGEFSSMSLSYTRGDREEDVQENYRRIGQVLGCPPENMTASQQTHTTNIRLVTSADKGKGVIRPLDYQDIDGLMTNEPGIALVTYYADCVPLLFVDPIHKAIGTAHSGWRGTVGRMGQCMVKSMRDAFGTSPEQLYAAIGPSICQDCYEVSEDVAEKFTELEEATEELRKELLLSGRYRAGNDGDLPKIIEPGVQTGKYQLDLWLANYVILRQAGIPLKRIAITDICTCHNSEYLFSHRASGGRRGNLAAFLMLEASGAGCRLKRNE